MDNTKEIYVTVRLVVKEDSSSQDIVDSLDFNFDHPDIRETEVTDWEG